MTVEEQVLEKLRGLPPQKQKEVLAFVSLLQEKAKKKTRRSLRGLWADLNVQISESDIGDARREMWGSFPRGTFPDGGVARYSRCDLVFLQL